MEQTNIRWVIAHEPAYLFYRVAEDFRRLVNQKSDSVKIDIEILTNVEYNDKYQPAEPITRSNLWNALHDNTVQITQVQTTKLAAHANPDMAVLDMPYLFADHDHAQRVLEGEVGRHLLEGFDSKSKLKGLAFTYSGGFRLMPFKQSVASLAEVAGQTVRSGMSPIAQDTMRAFGFQPVSTEIDEVSAVIQTGQAVGAEHVAQRLYPDGCEQWIDTIIDTQHSLFLTSIVVNTDWWNGLPQSVRSVFAECAIEAARNERALSIKDGLDSLARLAQSGVKIVEPSRDQKQDLQTAVVPVYEKYQTSFSQDLISKIRSQH